MLTKGRVIRGLIGIVALTLAVGARAELEGGQEVNGVIYYKQKPVVVDATAKSHSHKHKSRKRHRSRIRHKFVHPVSHRKRHADSGEVRAEARKQRTCAHLRHQMAKVESSLRAGYREPRGNQLRSREHQLQGQIFDRCD